MKKSVCWVSVFTQKGHIVDIVPYSQIGCLPYWFAEEHNCDMHSYSTKSHYVKYAGSFTSDYAINTISSCVLVFHCHYQSLYWGRFYLSQQSMDGYEAMYLMLHNWLKMRSAEQSLFTIKTNMPIPMLLYGDSFQCHHILPSNLDLTSHNKKGLHCTFWNSLIESLHIDLDGNLLPSNCHRPWHYGGKHTLLNVAICWNPQSLM